MGYVSFNHNIFICLYLIKTTITKQHASLSFVKIINIIIMELVELFI